MSNTNLASFIRSVADLLRGRYKNGRDCYAYHWQTLRVQPVHAINRPSADFFMWHNENRFRA